MFWVTVQKSKLFEGVLVKRLFEGVLVKRLFEESAWRVSLKSQPLASYKVATTTRKEAPIKESLIGRENSLETVG